MRVSLYGPYGKRQLTETIHHVFGLPRSAEPQAVAGSNDGALQRTVGKLGRSIAGGPYALMHKAGWISSARHDAGLVYWPGGVFVAAVMTTGSGVGVASDLLAGTIAKTTLERVASFG